jgi:dihydrofolate reductase
MGHPVIMGDITYETLPEKSRPLPGRENIVLSLNKEYEPLGDVKLFNSFNDSIEYVKHSNNEKAYIIGGATIYKLGLDVANVLEITRVHDDFVGDVRFPQINIAEWKLIYKKDHEGINYVNSEIVRFTYEKYIRI